MPCSVSLDKCSNEYLGSMNSAPILTEMAHALAAGLVPGGPQPRTSGAPVLLALGSVVLTAARVKLYDGESVEPSARPTQEAPCCRTRSVGVAEVVIAKKAKRLARANIM